TGDRLVTIPRMGVKASLGRRTSAAGIPREERPARAVWPRNPAVLRPCRPTSPRPGTAPPFPCTCPEERSRKGRAGRSAGRVSYGDARGRVANLLETGVRSGDDGRKTRRLSSGAIR